MLDSEAPGTTAFEDYLIASASFFNSFEACAPGDAPYRLPAAESCANIRRYRELAMTGVMTARYKHMREWSPRILRSSVTLRPFSMP
jgi:hypothetical protein